MKQPTVVSLFCGAGGMDLGFVKAGFKITCGIDMDLDSCNTHRNWSTAEILNANLSKINIEIIPKTDVILGSILARPFTAKSQINENYGEYMNLEQKLIRIINNKLPKIFILDGPKGLVNANGNILMDLLNSFESIGYNVSYKVLDAKDFGIAQCRERLLLVGTRKDLNIMYSFPTTQDVFVTVNDVLKDLDYSNLEDRTRVSISKLRKWNCFKKLNLDGLSPSINSHNTIIIGDYSLKPEQFFKISWQEAAAIQSFPKEFIFMGSNNSKFKQIAAAFPPKLAYYIAKELINIINHENERISIQKDTNEFRNQRKPFSRNNEIHTTNIIADSDTITVMSNKQNITEITKKGAMELIYELESLPIGKESSKAHEILIFACLNYIFKSSFTRGQRETPSNGGRKRSDIVFDNHANTGFFAHIRDRHHIFCPKIFVECKNYASDPKNPEMGQLLGRLGDRAGKFGILVCRQVKDNEAMLNRCKDAINQSKTMSCI